MDNKIIRIYEVTIIIILLLSCLGCTISFGGSANQAEQLVYYKTLSENQALEILDLTVQVHELKTRVRELEEKVKSVLENTLPYTGADGKPLKINNKEGVHNPTLSELKSFILKDDTNQMPYKDKVQACGEFAVRLHNNAEKAGIRGAFAAVHFEGGYFKTYETFDGKTIMERNYSHALNAFYTTDKGLVYIDCISHDTIAYIEIGKPLGFIDIDKAKSLQYNFYTEYEVKWFEYQRLVKDYNQLVAAYNKGSYNYMIEIKQRGQVLDNLESELSDYWIKPMGVVNNIEVYW